jgi:hypothetical protein
MLTRRTGSTSRRPRTAAGITTKERLIRKLLSFWDSYAATAPGTLTPQDLYSAAYDNDEMYAVLNRLLEHYTTQDLLGFAEQLGQSGQYPTPRRGDTMPTRRTTNRRRALNEPPTDDKPIDARLIFMDETEYLDDYMDEAERGLVAQVGSVYLYDANKYVYTASTQPVYEMIFLYPRVVLSKHAEQTLDESEFEELRDRLEQDLYASAQQPVEYFGVHDVDGLEKTLPDGDYYVIGKSKISYSEMSEEEQMEELREYYTSNVML